MTTIKALAGCCLVLCFLVGSSAAASGEELWTARTGTTTIAFDHAALQRLGLRVEAVDVDGRALDTTMPVSLDLLPDSKLTFSVSTGAIDRVLGGSLLHAGGISVASARGTCDVRPPSITRKLDPSSEPSWSLEAWTGGAGFTLTRFKAGFQPGGRTLTIHSPELAVSPAMAKALGDPRLAGAVIGKITTRAQADWVGGQPPEGTALRSDGSSERSVGPDMTFCQLYQLAQYGRFGDIVGLAVATTSWNIGDRDLMWFASPDGRHPFIVMNLYRLQNDRFEQIGMSAVKHGFYALGSTQCGTTCTFEPGHSEGDWLGVGCTDTYSSGLNAAQGGLAPRAEVNPWTGAWNYAGSHFALDMHTHNGIQHRLQVHDADLNPSQNPGATYYCEGYYAIADDINVMNSASWKPVTVSGSPGGTWTFGMSGSGTRPTIGFALDAWTGATQTILAQQVPPTEFVSPDGRCVLSAKATDLGGGSWHYEYALLNIDMNRKVKSFSVAVPPWAGVTNIGFHAVEVHDEPYSSTAWTSSLSADSLTWTTVDNPLTWGNLYNFRFDARVAPASGALVSLGMFEPGTPAVVTGSTIGPSAAVSGNALRGGLLWDKWWKVNAAATPTGNHPLYPAFGAQSGSTTYRCEECHGWDYKGAAGAYASGPHYTGIRGVFGTSKTSVEMFNLIKSAAVTNGHGFSTYGLSDQDILDLVKFIQEQVIDTGLYIDAAGQFLGDPVQGQVQFETGGWISCNACHGDDGTTINFGTAQAPQWVGTVAVYSPWEFFHKTRFGQPGRTMPSWLEWGGTNQGATDLDRYCQVSMPVDCITNANCALADPCNHIKMCQNGRCVASTLNGDLNGDGVADGKDIQDFVNALVAGSSDPVACSHADFSGNGWMDTDDLPCMVSTLLAP